MSNMETLKHLKILSIRISSNRNIIQVAHEEHITEKIMRHQSCGEKEQKFYFELNDKKKFV